VLTRVLHQAGRPARLKLCTPKPARAQSPKPLSAILMTEYIQKKKMNTLLQLTVLLLLFVTSCKTPSDKTDLLRNKIEQILSDKNAVVGVSIVSNNGKDTLSLNGDKRFPIQSVFKFHIALAVLS